MYITISAETPAGLSERIQYGVRLPNGTLLWADGSSDSQAISLYGYQYSMNSNTRLKSLSELQKVVDRKAREIGALSGTLQLVRRKVTVILHQVEDAE